MDIKFNFIVAWKKRQGTACFWLNSPSALTVLTTLKRLAIVVSFRSKFDTKNFQKPIKLLILLTKIKVERVKGIETSFRCLPSIAAAHQLVASTGRGVTQ
jgi:hypothetical protein